MRPTRLQIYRNVILALAVSFGPSAAIAAGSVSGKTCSQLKSTIKAKGTVYLRTARGTKRFAHSSFYCEQEEQLAWQIVRSRSGKCYLHVCRPYLNFR